MHLLMIVGTILWFVLVGLLWYARPGEVDVACGLARSRRRLLHRLLLVRDAVDSEPLR